MLEKRIMQSSDERNGLLDTVNSFVKIEDYNGAVNILKKIKNKKMRVDVCYMALFLDAADRVMIEHGEITIMKDREKYERAKKGLEDTSPHNILLVENMDDNSPVEGIEEMFDFVPDDNPLKQYYFEIVDKVS